MQRDCCLFDKGSWLSKKICEDQNVRGHEPGKAEPESIALLWSAKTHTDRYVLGKRIKQNMNNAKHAQTNTQ